MIEGTAGNISAPDSPMLSFTLLVHAATGRITGHGSISWFGGQIEITNVTGSVHKLHASTRPITQSVMLKGTYDEKGPPPTNFVVQREFAAHFATDAHWNGSGGFEYASERVEGVQVRHEAPEPPIHTLDGVVIHDAQATGDLALMKSVAAQADRQLQASSDVQAALTELNAEIAKLEANP